MIRGVGTDMVKIARFKDMPPRLGERLFTAGEREYIKQRPQTAAGIFAAKEAVVKALGTGFRGFWPAEVEIWHTPAGAPRVRLLGTALKIARRLARGRYRVHVSITHERDVAAAFAVFDVFRTLR